MAATLSRCGYEITVLFFFKEKIYLNGKCEWKNRPRFLKYHHVSNATFVEMTSNYHMSREAHGLLSAVTATELNWLHLIVVTEIFVY